MATTMHRLVQLLDRLVPPRRGLVVCHSAPDLDDMTLALLAAAPDDVSVVVLAEDRAAAVRRFRDLDVPPVTVRAKHGARGLWTYLRSEFSISTHGLFGCRSRGRRKRASTPWHGELTKQIGTLVGQPPKHFDLVATNTLQSKFLLATEFGLAPSRIHAVGNPRQVTMLASPRSARLRRLKQDRDWVVVVPTYRQSARSALQVDSSLSLEYQQESLLELAEVVERRGGTLWVRPHPVADPYTRLPDTVRLATDEELQLLGLTLYDLLGAADLLVTDYSSVWVDFLATGRPVLGFCPDIADYREARGLALEPYDAWFPGPIARTSTELCEYADVMLGGHDDEQVKRDWVRAVLCPVRPEAARDYWSQLLVL